MARPKKILRIEKNGESIKAYDEMGYAGSISIRSLCVDLRRKRLHPTITYKETGFDYEKTQNKDG